MADLTGMLQAAAGAVAAPADYQISRSLRFNSADSAYLNRTPASAGSRRTFTFSVWFKYCDTGTDMRVLMSASGTTTDRDEFRIEDSASGNAIQVFFNGTSGGNLITTQVVRDVSAWYHLVIAVDTTQATASNRVKIYLNGAQITQFATETYPTQNYDTRFNVTSAHNIGKPIHTSSDYWVGYMTEIHFVDGQALTPSDFGETDETTGVWKPKAYTGTYGTNGFYLNFSDNSGVTAATLGADSSGNGNNWTPNNFSVTAGAGNDSLVDTPTPYGEDTGAGGEVRGNYCTWNPLQRGPRDSWTESSVVLSNGNLQAVFNGTGDDLPATFAVNTGKWYWELELINAQNHGAGWTLYQNFISSAFSGSTSGIVNSRGQYGTGESSTNSIIVENGSTSPSTLQFNNGTIIGYAFDIDAGTMAIYVGGVLETTITSIPVGLYVPIFGDDSSADASGIANFGQRPFAYTAPSGFKALCTQNLPEPTVVQGDDYFNTVLYTGTGSSQSITGVGFQPDWVWIKERSGIADHGLYDAVRGTTKQLESNTTTAETAEATGLTAFGSDGFTVGALAQLNTNTDTYVAWNWNAGGSNATNTDGTITSTVRASTTSGFSIVTYTGTGSAATVGHGLGVAPAMIIVKNRDAADAWQVYHQANTAAPETDYLVLNTGAATADNINRWNDTAPTSTVFSIGNGVEVNTNTEDYIAYVFAEIEGFSKFGSYTGNGSTNGPFVYCGFRPAFVLIKRTNTTSDWWIEDTKRNPYNVIGNLLVPNGSAAEFTGSAYFIDMLSNGFKLRNTSTGANASGSTYIFMAFAENPFKYSLAR